MPERRITHRAVAPVARLMGYTPQGLKELCEACLVTSVDWRIIGLTRKTNERVAAKLDEPNGRLMFSVGTDSLALTDDEEQAQRIRDEVAEAIVNRIKATRPVVNKQLLKTDEDHPSVDDQGSTDGLSRPETMIISPVAPRDPRGLEALERRLSGPRKGMSAH